MTSLPYDHPQCQSIYWNLVELQENTSQKHDSTSRVMHYLRLMFDTQQCIGKKEAPMAQQRQSHLAFIGRNTIDKILNYERLNTREEQLAIQSIVHHYSQDRATIRQQLTLANKLYYWTIHKM